MKRRHTTFTMRLMGSSLLVLLSQVAWSQEIRPFVARYEARYHGISGGTIELTLRKGAQPNEYVYESRAKPGFIAAFLILNWIYALNLALASQILPTCLTAAASSNRLLLLPLG